MTSWQNLKTSNTEASLSIQADGIYVTTSNGQEQNFPYGNRTVTQTIAIVIALLYELNGCRKFELVDSITN
jgi:hypothetical protein